MTDREIMQQALEALERVMSHGPAVQEAKDILRTLLAQPEQPPVPWSAALESVWGEPKQKPVQYKCKVIDDHNLSGVPLEQWVKPTKREAWRWHDLSLHDIKSAIEAKLKEKNA